MKLGFSGTRFGMTDLQVFHVKKLLLDLSEIAPLLDEVFEVHHGDCVGADAQFHHMAKSVGARVVIHPPTDDRHRAFCEGDEMRDPYPHLIRNDNIVRESEFMITAPPTVLEQVRGGTWSTNRKAAAAGKLWRTVLPSGIVVKGRQ